MSLLIQLFWEFFKTGLFAVGGGLATLPFLYEISEKTGWYTVADISNLVAVSESTPGPMGINMATYVGFTTGGVCGSFVAVIGLIVPSLVIIMIVSNFLSKFKSNKYVQYAFYGLRAASTALIVSATLGIVKLAFTHSQAEQMGFNLSIINWLAVALAVVIFFLYKKFKGHPVIYILCAAVAGVLLQL